MQNKLLNKQIALTLGTLLAFSHAASMAAPLPEFLGVTQFPLAEVPVNMTQCDLNNDGFPDVASVNWGADFFAPDVAPSGASSLLNK